MREHSDGLMGTLRCLPINAAESFVYTRPRAFSARRWTVESQRPTLGCRISAQR
jgi:hypothetical protein